MQLQKSAMRHLAILICFATCVMMSKTSTLKNELYIFQNPENSSNKILLMVTWEFEEGREKAVGCKVISNPQLIEEVMSESNDKAIRSPTDQELRDILNECSQISRRQQESSSFKGRSAASKRSENYSSHSPRNGRRVDSDEDNNTNNEKNQKDASRETTNEISREKVNTTALGRVGRIPFLFPGTKWCGSGDRARSYDDLGIHKGTDKCCRAHDLCDDIMESGETKNNLTNKSLFTKLHCRCDKEFYDCLKTDKTLTSNTLGNIYFNFLKRECYEEDYPLTKNCIKYTSFLKLSCSEYQRDLEADKEFQWKPAEKY